MPASAINVANTNILPPFHGSYNLARKINIIYTSMHIIIKLKLSSILKRRVIGHTRAYDVRFTYLERFL